MNRVSPINPEVMISHTGEKALWLFISNRLLRLMLKKLELDEWDFAYFRLEKSGKSRYTAHLISLDGLIIFTRKK